MRLRPDPFPAQHRVLLALAGVACSMAAAPSALAQDAAAPAGNSGFVLRPTLAADETYIETRARLNGSNGRESVSRLSPGLRLSSRSGSIRGALDYTGSLLYRVGREESAGREFQNALDASFLVEAVKNWAFIDTRATITQQSISAFGQQSVQGSLQSNNNRTEVSTISLSPYVRGDVGNVATYEVRLNGNVTNSRAAEGADSKSAAASVLLQSARRGALLGWTLNASRQRVAYRGSTSNTVDSGRGNATVSLMPDPALRLSASVGRESVDQSVGAEHRADTTSGLALQWNPSPRTSLDIDLAERYFGRSTRIGFSHRLPRSVLSYSMTRDVTQGADAFSLGAPTTMFQLLYAQAASAYPDPAAREQAVLAQLNSLGVDPNQLVNTGFLSSTLSLQRRQDLGFIWLGQRTTLNVQAFTNALTQLVSFSGADTVEGEAIRVHGYSSTLSYRLTPQTSITGGGSRQMTFATSTKPGNDLKSANLSLTSQIGLRTTAQLGARYTVFNSDTDPYRETSVSASLSLRY